MRKEMLPVIPELTGTEYSSVGFWLSVGILALLIALAGYIAGRSAAKRFGGKKATTASIFSAVALVTSAALICFFGVSATAIRGSVMCIIMLYACTQDIKTRECDDFLSVMLGITGISGKEPSELVKDIFAFAAIVLQKPYMHNKTSTGRKLCMPDEVRRLAKDKAILLIRGAKPLLLNKITPEEHPSFKLLKYCKAAEHIPEWRKEPPVKKTKKPPAPKYSLQFEIPVDGEEEEKEEGFDLSGGIDCRSLKKLNERDI